MTLLRQSQIVVETLVQVNPNLRQGQEVVETLVQVNPKLRQSQVVTESLVATNSLLRASQIVVETLVANITNQDYDNSLSIAGVSASSVAVIGTNLLSQTVAGFASSSVSGGFPYYPAITTESISAFTILPGYGYSHSITLTTLDDFTTRGGFDYNNTLQVDGISDASISATYFKNEVITVAGIGAFTALVAGSDIFVTLTITSIGTFTSPGGSVLYNYQPIEGFSAVSLLPGFGRFDTLSIDGVSDASTSEVYYMQEIVSVDAEADFATEFLYTGGVSLTITSIAQVVPSSIATMDSAFIVSSRSNINLENLFNILLDTVSIATFVTSNTHAVNPDEMASSSGSFNAQCQAVFNRTTTQTLALTQTVIVKKPTQRASQTLVMSQLTRAQKIHIETITQALTVTQILQGFRGMTQHLTFSQAAGVVKVHNRSVSQTLILSQAATRTATINRAISQTLSFNIPMTRKAPIIGSINGGQQTQFEQSFISATAYLVPTNCLVILSVASQTVVLPCPIFGDTQAQGGTLDLKRTMTGDTFTYVRKTRLEKLKYSFHVGSYKAYEMKQFLLNHSHELITLMNWKGETWLVMITNNPVEFVNTGRWQNKGERVEFTLEFEGVKR